MAVVYARVIIVAVLCWGQSHYGGFLCWAHRGDCLRQGHHEYHSQIIEHQPSLISHRTPFIMHQSSNISHHPSIIEQHSSGINHRKPVITQQSSNISHHSPTIEHQSSGINHRTPVITHPVSGRPAPTQCRLDLTSPSHASAGLHYISIYMCIYI